MSNRDLIGTGNTFCYIEFFRGKLERMVVWYSQLEWTEANKWPIWIISSCQKSFRILPPCHMIIVPVCGCPELAKLVSLTYLRAFNERLSLVHCTANSVLSAPLTRTSFTSVRCCRIIWRTSSIAKRQVLIISHDRNRTFKLEPTLSLASLQTWLGWVLLCTLTLGFRYPRCVTCQVSCSYTNRQAWFV